MREWPYTASTRDLLYTYTAERRDVLGCTSPTTKRFPEAREMSRGRSPRDIWRDEGNHKVRGDVQPNSSRFEAVYSHSLIINPSLGMCSTYSVEINTSLPMMREWVVHPRRPRDFPWLLRCPLGFALGTSLRIYCLLFAFDTRLLYSF